MRRLLIKTFLPVLAAALVVVSVFGIGAVSTAQVSIDFPTQFVGLSSQDLKDTIENIVRIVLGFIGVIFLLLILYGGFTWMTSQGEQDKVNRAKKMIAAAVIGLLITLASYSIASFIIGTLQQAVSPGPPGPPGICGNGIVEPGEQCDGQPGCTGLCVWLPGVNGQCMSTPPPAGAVKICSVIGGSQSGGVMRIYGHNFGAYLPGESKVFLNSGTAGPGGDVAEAQVISCGGSIVWNSGYIEAITPTVAPGPYQVVVQADLDGTVPFDDRCDGGVQETPLYPPGDCQPVSVQAGAAPVLYCITPSSAPNDNNNGTDPTITLDGKNLGSTAGTVEMQADTGVLPIAGAAIQSWDDTQIVYTKPDNPAGSPILITGDVAVIDSGAVRSNNTKLFTVTCSAPSSTSAECATGCCTASLQCQAASVCAVTPPGGAPGDPFITGLSPDNGEEGTYVTIFGRNFGANPSAVSYKQPSGTWVTIVSPYVSNPSCTSNWSDTQIIFEVPQDAGTPDNSPPDAEVYVRNSVIGRDSNHVAFTQNDIVRPGLCRVDPNSGYYQTPFDLYGNNFASLLAPSDYVAYWKFDDASGTVATDSSGNNHNGTLSCKQDPTPGAPPCTLLPQWSTGKVGGALTFSGALTFDGGTGDYVNLGDLSAYRHPLTISFWYYLPETNLPGAFFLGNASLSTVYPYYVIHPRDGGSLHFYHPDYGASQNILNTAPRWIHIAYVTDSASLANWRTYVNGVQQTNTYTETGIPVNFDAAGTYLGGSNIATVYLKGSIDELRIYDRALSSSEITQVMQAAPSDIYFGQPSQKISANNKNFTSNTTASAEVPNLQASNTTVAVNVDGQDSNPLGFTVRGTASGDPIVTSINPNSGPTGTYVTILGSNFGTQQGSVYFARQTVTSCPQRTFDGVTRFACLADTNFPPICSTDIWRNDRIVVKVPSGLQVLDEYFLIVQRLDGKASQTSAIQGVNASFIRNTAPLTPGICRIDPLGGPEGTPVRYDGENFGLGIGTVRFDVNRSSAPSLWNWRQAIGPVPVGSVTGSTSVASQSGLFSNRLPFFVGSCTSNTQCGSGFCCTGICRPTAQCTAANTGETRWLFTSEELPFDLEDSVACTLGIQSPTPYPHDQAGTYSSTDPEKNAPLDSDIAALFTRALDFVTIWDGTAANVKVVQCNSTASAFSCPASPPTVSGTFTQVGTNGWKFHPASPLNPSTWYEVRLDDNGALSSRIRARDGSGYKGSAFLGALGTLESFRWHFGTRSASQPLCEVNDVRLSPSAMTVNVKNTSDWMTAIPISAQCYICGSTGYQYSWVINPNPASPNQYANFTPVTPPTTYRTQFFGVNVTTAAVPPYSNVTATINNPPSGAPITSSVPAQLTVDYVRPRVIRNGPSGACSRICQNTLAFADFNVSLAASTITAPQRVRIYQCNQPNCTGLLSSTHTDMTAFAGWTPSFATGRNPDDRIEFTSAAFQTNTWYRVVVQGNVTNTQGQSLDQISINDPTYGYDTNGDGVRDAYSWYFQTSDTQCQPDYAEVLPNPGTINTIGGKLGFSSSIWSNSFLGVPGCESIPLNPNGFDWEWLVANPNPPVYATITTNGRCSNNAAVSCTADPICGFGNQCIGSHQQTATAVQTNSGIPTVVVTAIQGSWITPSADLYVNDTREPIALIGHRPDKVPPGSPPEDNIPFGSGDTICDIGTSWILGSGDPAQCTLQCTNVMTSAIFNTHLNASSFNYYTIPGDYAGYYSFNQESTADESGNGNNGTLQPNPGSGNAPTFSSTSASSALRKSITFDGIDDYVTAGDVSAFELDNQNLTITFWVKSDSAPAVARSVISKGKVFNMTSIPTLSAGSNCGTPSNYGWEVIQMSDRYRFGTCSNGTFAYDDTSTFSTNDNQWHFIAITFSRTDRSLRITADGIQNPGTFVDNTNPIETNSFCFGSRCDSYFFKGSLDDIRVYRHNALAGERPFSDGVLQQIRLEGIEKQVPPLNFHVVEYPTGVLVPGTVKVTNYTQTSGLCDDFFTPCSTNAECLAAGTGATICTLQSNKRGRADFYPEIGSVRGIYDANQAYQAIICPNDSCTIKPIKSSQGVLFTDSYQWGFTTGQNICKISFIDIVPNPALFADRTRECHLTNDAPICKDGTPKTLTAQAKDATGLDLSAVAYTWRETSDVGGPYSTAFYYLDQPAAGVESADIRHKGKLGIDYAQVTAASNDPALDLGTKSEQALLNFSFCQNPWLGDAANNTYYLDVPYDLKLAYCRDTDSAAALLPNLPNPHVERTSPGFGQGGDLLKEHVFVVGTQTGGTTNLSDQPPYFTVPSNSPAVSLPGFTASSYFKYGDLVSFTLKAKDPDGDNFQFVMQNDAGESDTVPASASFNPKTGAFIWVIDKLPATDSDGDGKNDFALRFTLNPAGAAPNEYARVVIDVESITPPTPVDYPVVRFTTPTEGDTITSNYGQTVSFSAVVDSYGAGTSVKSFVWDFQDSGLSTYTNTAGPYSANHVFLQQGQHQVTFRVQNNLNVWSLPATVNVYVLPKTSLKPSESRIASEDGGVRALFSQWAKAFVGTALGQSFSQPSQLTANSVGTAPDIELRWKNNGTYASITIYRDGSVLASGLPGGSTIYTDPGVAVGTTYLYRVCGVIGTQEKCEQVTVTARNVSYDVIVARVYKNLDSFSVTEWYKAYAPNPIGAPKPTQIDGYDAIVDGTSVYIGVANCAPNSGGSNDGTCSHGVYTNVLLLSYNQGAKASTVEIFNRLLADLRINESLVTRDDNSTINTCSEDPTIICDPGHDAVCAAKNAGLCQSAKAELRRDYKRIVDLHDVAGALYTYASQHTFCDDGTNSIACNTDADCPGGNLCVGVYPALTAGSYIGGMSTSKWPSWQQTLAKELGRTDLAHDPINRFGANFYSSTPARCADLTPAGYDENTCWNERSSQFQCHSGSEVYMYRNVRGNNFNLYGLAEAQNWNWIAQDPKVILNDASYGGICSNTAPVTAVCGNGVIENTPSGDIYVVVNTPRKTTNVSATDIYVGGSGVYNPGDPIRVYDASSQAVITDASAPTNAGGLQIQRLLYNGLPRVHVKLQPSSRDYEAVIAIQGGRVRRLISDHASFGTGSPFGGPGLEKTNGSCFGQSEDRLIAQTPSSVDFCMEVTSVIDQFYIDIDAGRETCDGGTANYCDITFGPANWNNDFKVGCEPTCTAWGDPYSGDLTAARAACGGACGDGTIDAAEQCDPSASPNGAESYSCTGGSTAYCSASCVISCASGRPYSGSCGDGIVKLPEVCDEGTSLNGTPGHCNKTCSGYGSYCGDGTLTPLDESSLGCQCDSSITSASCSTGYRPIAGDACVNFNCSALPAHQWSCVANLEECENVIGLTSYSCPASEALYCDTSCNRACTSIDIDSSTGRRQNAAVYEHYFSSGTVEDNDYTLIKKADTPYATKAIVFYAYPAGSSTGNVDVCRYKSDTGADHRLVSTPGACPDLSSQNYTLLGVEFEAFSATGTNRAPVYEFLSQSGTVPDYYYSRNNVPRIDNQNKPYVIQNNGNPVFWAMLGPFQETCGNGSIEGNETCEPSTYQTPTASQSSATQQYACGEPFTPNACRIYGGYCGDAAKDSPFEQCDEGSAAPFNCSVTTAVTCTSDANCPVSTCGRNIPGRCDLNNTISCSKDSDCPQNTCIGNGAQCNNNANNCTYCTASCSQAIVPRNYCGDGIVNCGLQTPTDCTDQDPYTEVCDDGTANNGKPGQCNETCTGRTGAVCGNNIREQTCNNDTSIACTVNTDCPQPGGVCSGEVCDDGANNGRWTYTCRTSPGVQCLVDADCPNPNPAECTGEPYNYCSFSCLGRTPAVCGDSIVQQPNWGQDRIEGTSDDRNELCDSGIMNGTAGFCNTTCTGITPAVCGDGIVGSGTCDRSEDVFGAPQPCQTDAECTDFPNDFCRGGESCDPPASTTTQACTDAGKPGLQTSQCNSSCQTVNTQCHAFGLKIWSDGVDLAYLNGSLMLLPYSSDLQCFADPDLQTADYSWPTSPPPPAPGVSSNQCLTPSSRVSEQDKYAVSDVRPLDSSGKPVAGAFEINGKNVVAVKIWAKNPADPRSFQAVYTSPTANRLYPTTSGQSSPWACSHVFTPGWQKVSCPACDPTLSSGTWRRPFSYTGNPGTPLCNTNYTNQVGTTAQWIWGDDCKPTTCSSTDPDYPNCQDADPVPGWVYCRLEYISSGSPVQAAWNPNFGWVHMSTAGGGRVHIEQTDSWPKPVHGAAWNRNLGWLHFYDADTAADGTTNPILLRSNRVTVDQTTGQLKGVAWGKNFGRVIFNPVDTCGGKICSTSGLVCTIDSDCDASGLGQRCEQVNCTQGYGLRSYQNTRRDPTSGVVTGYAWSEQAGWIDFSAYTQSTIYMPEY